MILARAPYRVSLGGGGTDLPSYYSQHGGFILSAAVNKYLYIYVNRPAADDFIRLKYSRYEQVSAPDEIQHDLVRPALKELGLGGSLEIASMADVPAGTGLGSSGTYLVALLTALHELKREKVPTQALAEQACHIEMDIAGHPAGKQDPYLAAFGGFTCLDIDTDGRVKVSPLDISITAVEEFRANVLLFYTGLTRNSSEILGAQRQDTERRDEAVVESLHRTKELGYRIKETLEQGDLERFGLLLDEHWQNKKRRSAKISDAKIDYWYDVVKSCGGLGGKIMGAGGGGFFMFFCPNHCKGKIRKALADMGLREMPYDFDFEGAKVLVNF
ncbi:MAG TPA: galactokinase [Blastocatellia bacterium]|jgi:D-glycero-alpha-D-manno-heptose-7-phosphate kinase|nr:galactokinase [Blastocatellia bacterium]